MHPNYFSEPEWLALADAILAPPLELPKARRKSLSSIGHLVERFAATCDRLRAHVSDHFMPDLRPWLRPMANLESCSLRGDGLIVCLLQMSGDKFQLYPLALPATHALSAVELWMRSHPNASESLPPMLPIAEASVNSPLWPALMHLRPLREFWERELRRSAVESLLEILPNAWLLDPTPLPPGTVIPKLELASWSDLSTLRETQRHFVIASVSREDSPMALDNSMPEAQWQQMLEAALHSATSNPKILLELTPPSSDTKTLLSFYSKISARVDWLGAVAVSNEGAQYHLHRVE